MIRATPSDAVSSARVRIPDAQALTDPSPPRRGRPGGRRSYLELFKSRRTTSSPDAVSISARPAPRLPRPSLFPRLQTAPPPAVARRAKTLSVRPTPLGSVASEQPVETSSIPTRSPSHTVTRSAVRHERRMRRDRRAIRASGRVTLHLVGSLTPPLARGPDPRRSVEGGSVRSCPSGDRPPPPAVCRRAEMPARCSKKPSCFEVLLDSSQCLAGGDVPHLESGRSLKNTPAIAPNKDGSALLTETSRLPSAENKQEATSRPSPSQHPQRLARGRIPQAQQHRRNRRRR